MTVAIQDKSKVRKDSFARRKQARAEAVNAAEDVRDHLLASRLLTGAKVISGYCPIRTEIDPIPLMKALHTAGHQIAVPVIMGEGLPLEFHEWWPGIAMQDGAFGAAVPVDGNALVPNVLLVPLLAFDRRGWRLGYGGGFYDRTLEGLRASGAVRAIGLAYATQEIDTVPTEPTDQPLDAIATERGVLKPSRDQS